MNRQGECSTYLTRWSKVCYSSLLAHSNMKHVISNVHASLTCSVHTCCMFQCPNFRYDQRGYALHSQSLTATGSVGSGGKMNWKTLSDVKSENLGHGEKVRCKLIHMKPRVFKEPGGRAGSTITANIAIKGQRSLWAQHMFQSLIRS